MKIKSTINVLFILSVLLLSNSCNGSRPDKVVLKYLKNLQQGRYENAYNLLSRKDRSLATLEDFSRMEHTPVSRNVQSMMKYSVVESVISQTGRGATVTLEITSPDLVRIYDRFPDLLTHDKNRAWVDAFFVKNRGEIERYAVKTVQREYNLVLHDGKWYIQADYGPKMIIAGLMHEGTSYADEYDYVKAVEKYQEVLQIDPNHVRAADKLLRVQEKLGLVSGMNFSWRESDRTDSTVFFMVTLQNPFSYMIKSVIVLAEIIDISGVQIEQRQIEMIGPEQKFIMIGHQQTIETGISIEALPAGYKKVILRILDVGY